MKILSVKRMSIPKVAVLATGLTAAMLVGTMSPQAASADPNRTADCTSCHGSGAVSGTVTAVPSTTTAVAGAAYTVLVTPPTSAAGGDTGYRITDAANTIVATGGYTGSGATSYTANMVAPATTTTYTVWAVIGPRGATSVTNFATYTITVGTTPTSTPPTTAPVTTAPVTTAPVTTAPVTTAPVTTAPVTTAPAAAKPLAPLDVAAEAGDTEALVTWSFAEDAGPGTVYTVTSNPGVITTETEGINGAIVSGLTNGTSYTFTVTGTTANGTSEASNVSNAVTPTAGATTLTVPAPTTTPAATTAPVVVADASAIIPVGAPDTGAGGTSGATDGPLVGLGGLTLILAGAGATQVIRRRRQA